ncbi:hypothetical protein BGZ72_002777 [Mortierella alpina]|nr:hypothetical protein BGZ72_002777 [Mortierella alpina]
MDGYRTGNGAEQQSYDGGITINNNNHINNNNNNNIHHGQMDLAQEQRSLKFPGVHVQQQQPFKQLQPEQQRHYPREQLGDETNIVSNSNNRTQQRNRMLPPATGPDATPAATTAGPSDLTKRASIPLSSSTTLSTPSPIVTSTTSSAVTATRTITNDSNSLHTRASTSSTTQSRNKQRRKKRRHSYYYIAFRILFSCGLAALALYWPASKRKPPLGYLPNLRESQNQHQGDDSVSHHHNNSNNNSTGGGDTQHNSTITPTIVARAFLSFEPSKKLDPTPPTTSTTLSTTPSFRTKSKRQRSSFDDDNNNNNGAPIEDDNSSDNVESAASDHYGTSGSGKGPGGHIPPNLRPGGPGSGGYGSHWCSLEEAFGDNQSAVVYCQVKDVRPIMTYVWASLILLELCVAYCAGDFSVAGTRHQRHSQSVSGGDRSAHDDDDRKGDLESRTGAAVAVAATDNYPEMEERQPQWTTVGPGQDQAQRQGRQLGGHSGISITVTEADAEGAGVGYSGSMDRGPTFAWKSSSTDKPIDH